jgi:beta-glucosidase
MSTKRRLPDPRDIVTARGIDGREDALYLTLEGRYTDGYLKQAGADAPKFSPDDLKTIAEPVDFVGINVCRPNIYAVATDLAPGYRDVGLSKSHPKMFSSWHALGAEALYWAPRHVRTLWNAQEIHITENGCASDDTVAPDGVVYDTDRVMFLRSHLRELRYFQWSLMDNFEWTSRRRSGRPR